MIHKRTTPKIFHRARALRHMQTPEEAKLWERLRNHQLAGVKFRRQHAIGNFIADFCAPNKKLVVELDGSWHFETEEQDAGRTAFLNSKGYKVIRLSNFEINGNIDAVLRKIHFAMELK